jgi:site-specific recombinase XerD
MNKPWRPSLEQILAAQVEYLAPTRRPGTVACYRAVARRFLRYLQATHPEVHRLSHLRRDPHLLGWLRSLCECHPPLANCTRQHTIYMLRRLLDDVAAGGQHRLRAGLILRTDFPPSDRYLPRPLSPEDDQRLMQELRRSDDLVSNALLLLRATGMRIGECLRLTTDCLRHVGEDQWAIHVPLGKLHTERWVPVDYTIRQILDRVRVLRAATPGQTTDHSAAWLFLLPNGRRISYARMHRELRGAALKAGCAVLPKPHQLRHSYASELLRAGVSLPAVQRLLGHADIRMTLRYVQVTQQDLQREFRLARQTLAQCHLMPPLPVPTTDTQNLCGLPAILQSLTGTRHLLAVYASAISDGVTQRKLQRLTNRLCKVSSELEQLNLP